MVINKKRTMVGFVLDETGSMETVKDATISGFNEYINSLKKNGDSFTFTLVKFNSTKINKVHSDVPISKVKLLTDKTYNPDNMTPLYDAIAKCIHTIEEHLKKAIDDCDACEERFTCFTADNSANCDKKPAVLLVVMTDGFENASLQYNRMEILDLIQKKESEGWTFAYLGANQDAWGVGQSIGIRGGNTMTYANTPDSLSAAFSSMTSATCNYVDNGSSCRDLSGKTVGFFSEDDKGLDVTKKKKVK